MRGRLMKQTSDNKTASVAVAIYKATTETHLPPLLFIFRLLSPLAPTSVGLGILSGRSSSLRSFDVWFSWLFQAAAPAFVHLPSKLNK